LTWSVYILKCADKSLYTGITNNIARRLEDHESGNGAKYTKGRGPFKLVYQEFLENRSLSTKRESEIKKLNKQEKFALIDSRKERSRDL
jgi:putative endonuclease